jgi:hypothetical protein
VIIASEKSAGMNPGCEVKCVRGGTGMASLPGPESRDVQEMIRHLKWSHAEKQIARKAFELALDREFRNVIRRATDMAGNI